MVTLPKRTSGPKALGGVSSSPSLHRAPVYIRVRGRIYKLMPKALTNYMGEYGLKEGVSYGFGECLDHIASEMAIALSRKRKPVGIRGLLFQYESPSLLFKVIGSKVVNIRISLRTGPSAYGGDPDCTME